MHIPSRVRKQYISPENNIALQIAREEMGAQAALSAFKSILLINGGCGITLINIIPRITNTDGKDLLTWATLCFFLGAFIAIVAMIMAWNEKIFRIHEMESSPSKSWLPGQKIMTKYDTSKFSFLSSKACCWISIAYAIAGFLFSASTIVSFIMAAPKG